MLPTLLKFLHPLLCPRFVELYQGTGGFLDFIFGYVQYIVWKYVCCPYEKYWWFKDAEN